MLLMFSLLPLLSGCDNEDDVIGIFTGKTWKLSRLANKDSNRQFYSGLWKDEEAKRKSRRSFRLAQHQCEGYGGCRKRCTGQGIHLRIAKRVQV